MPRLPFSVHRTATLFLSTELSLTGHFLFIALFCSNTREHCVWKSQDITSWVKIVKPVHLAPRNMPKSKSQRSHIPILIVDMIIPRSYWAFVCMHCADWKIAWIYWCLCFQNKVLSESIDYCKHAQKYQYALMTRIQLGMVVPIVIRVDFKYNNNKCGVNCF